MLILLFISYIYIFFSLNFKSKQTTETTTETTTTVSSIEENKVLEMAVFISFSCVLICVVLVVIYKYRDTIRGKM